MLKLHKDVEWCWPWAWTSFVHRPVLRACPLADPMLQRASCKALGDLCGRPGRLLGSFWVLSEASWRPVEVSRRLLGTLSGILESSWTRPGASWNHCGGILGAPGAVWEASWALLEPPGRRLGRSWSHSRGVSGARGVVWKVSWALWAAFCRYAEIHRSLDDFH